VLPLALMSLSFFRGNEGWSLYFQSSTSNHPCYIQLAVNLYHPSRKMKTKTALKVQRMSDSNIGGLPLNTTDIPQSLLNIDNKDRSNLFPWRGQFSPQFVETILDKYARPGFHVLDPFAGSGTVLYEAGLKSLHTTGAEINPAAYRMACTYHFINEDMPQRVSAISSLDNALKELFPSKLTPFSGQSEEVESRTQEVLIKLNSEVTNPLSRLLLETLIIRLESREGYCDVE
jgi:DNA methylase